MIELKRQAQKGVLIKENSETFCFESIVLVTRTYLVETYRYSYEYPHESKNSCGTRKIYNVEVLIDGRTSAERWGTSAKEMNNQYLILKSNCEG